MLNFFTQIENIKAGSAYVIIDVMIYYYYYYLILYTGFDLGFQSFLSRSEEHFLSVGSDAISLCCWN